MKKISTICDWDLDVNLESEKSIELWVDQNPIPEKEPGVIRIGLLIEPEEIRRSLGLVTFLDRFDFILTHNQDIINSRKNAFLYEFGGCWTRDYNFGDKKFGVSTLIGGKKLAPGHNIRTQVLNRSGEINIPKRIWLSKNFPPRNSGSENPILSGSKSDMFDTQFHICIENVKRDNWFTEKLLDCLYTKTIPIYYGCPNIGKWFDTRGFVVVDNATDIIESCNKLTPEYYEKHLEFVEENFKRAQNYMDVSENVKRSIEKNIIPLI